MINLLILSNSLETVQKITNKIVSHLESVRIVGIVNTISDMKDIIMEHEPDLIITTNNRIFNLLKEHFVFFYPGVILISKVVPEVEDEKEGLKYDNALIIDYHTNFKNILEQTELFIKDNLTISKKSKAIKTLSYIGFDFKWSGTNYLLDCILYVNSYKGSCSYDTLYYDVYPIIAKMNNTTTNVVKWGIERAIKYVYSTNGSDTYERIFKYTGVEYPNKITAKFIITFISNKLTI